MKKDQVSKKASGTTGAASGLKKAEVSQVVGSGTTT